MNVLRASRSKFKLMALAPLFAVLALTCWALASPVGSSPDDDFHLASTWCAAGTNANECHAVSDQGKRAVPGGLVKGRCFAGNGEQSAACQGTSLNDTQNGFVTTKRVNLRGFYPPLYYLAMHLFVTSNIAVSAVLMRIVNLLLFVGLTSVLYALLPASRRRPLLWGWAVTLVPLGLFLVASNNPSGWAIISGGTLWISLVGYFEASGARKAGLGAVAALATLLGAGARADGAVYAVVAIAVAVLLTASLNRRWVISALLPFALAVMAALFYLSARQSSVALSGIPARGATHQIPWHNLLFTDLLNVPSLWAGVFGSWELGWLDTPVPAIVWVGGLGAFAAIVFAGLASPSLRRLLALAMVLGALWLIPTYTLVQSGVTVGTVVQPRYILPLVIMLGGIALMPLGGPGFRLSRTQLALLVSTLSVANAAALHFNMRRYITGTGVTGWNLNSAAQWWWNIPVSPMMIWAAGSLSFAAFLVVIAWGTHSRVHGDLSAGQAVTR